MKYPAKVGAGLLALITCGILLVSARGQDEALPNFPDRSLASFLTVADNTSPDEPAAAEAAAPEAEAPEAEAPEATAPEAEAPDDAAAPEAEAPPAEDLTPAEEVAPGEEAAPAAEESGSDSETLVDTVPRAEGETPQSEATLVFRPIEERKEAPTLADVNEALNVTLEVVDFRDANLLDVLRGLTQKARLNYVINPQLAVGKTPVSKLPVSLHLENVKLSVVLDNILKINGLDYVLYPEENLIRIVHGSSVGVEKIETKTDIIQINWVNATTLAKTLATLKSKNGKIVPNQETNSLIVTDTPPSLENIRKLVDSLDKPERQVQVEARLVDMNNDALRQLGVDLQASRADSSGNSPRTRTTEYQTLIPGTPSTTDPDTGAITPGKGPTVEKYELETAVDVMNSAFPVFSDPRVVAPFDWAFGDVLSIFGQSFDVAARIQALETRKIVEILANPRVVTLNNLEATIDITRQIPYTDTIQQSGNNNLTITWQTVNEGVKVVVLPIITPNGFVRMNLKTTQDISRGRVEGATSRPLIDTRKADTNVIVRSGETVMIGGLRQLNLSDSTSGIPWFHEIPVLGWLFKSKSNNQSKTELYLFVTPTIIEKGELNSDQKGWYDRIDTKWHLPDYFFDDVRTQDDK